MKLRGAIALALLAVPVVAWTATGPAGAQAPACLPTSERTIGPHGFPGLGVKRIAPVYTDAHQFALTGLFPGISPGAAQREADALNSEGFVSGIVQRYFGKKRKTRGDLAVSVAYQLGSPEQAQAQLNRDLALNLKEARWKRFTVPAIPGSLGLRTKVDRGGASNVLFTDGDYSYLLGRFVKRGGTGAKPATNAAVSFYNRVHGAAVCP
jgi:hypothetical protein